MVLKANLFFFYSCMEKNDLVRAQKAAVTIHKINPAIGKKLLLEYQLQQAFQDKEKPVSASKDNNLNANYEALDYNNEANNIFIGKDEVKEEDLVKDISIAKAEGKGQADTKIKDTVIKKNKESVEEEDFDKEQTPFETKSYAKFCQERKASLLTGPKINKESPVISWKVGKEVYYYLDKSERGGDNKEKKLDDDIREKFIKLMEIKIYIVS